MCIQRKIHQRLNITPRCARHNTAKLGVTGMWWGITAGLTITAVLLGRRVWVKTGVDVVH